MAVSHGKHLLTGGLEPLGERGLLGRRGSHGPILDWLCGAVLVSNHSAPFNEVPEGGWGFPRISGLPSTTQSLAKVRP